MRLFVGNDESRFINILLLNLGIYFGYSIFNLFIISQLLLENSILGSIPFDLEFQTIMIKNIVFFFPDKFSYFSLTIHAMINVGISIYHFQSKQKEIAKAYLLSALLIVLT